MLLLASWIFVFLPSWDRLYVLLKVADFLEFVTRRGTMWWMLNDPGGTVDPLSGSIEMNGGSSSVVGYVDDSIVVFQL